MKEKRQFNRVTCEEKVFVSFDGGIITANLRNISLRGALVKFDNEITFLLGDILNISLTLNDSDIVLHFRSKVMYQSNNIIGVKIIQIDLDSMIHLRGLIEARSTNMEQVTQEFAYF